jgi:hypothetical protein
VIHLIDLLVSYETKIGGLNRRLETEEFDPSGGAHSPQKGVVKRLKAGERSIDT